MADELPPIRARLLLDDAQVAEVMASVGQKSETMGQSMKRGSEAGRLGMWSLGESAENLAQSLGVPHQMSRQLGNSVENLASSFGKYAAAMGIVGLAAMAAYAIWSKFNAEKKKEHEELEKSVDGLLKEESALAGNKIQTTELQQANERLHAVKKRILDQNFAEWMKQEREEIEKLTEKIVEMKDRGYTGLIAPIMNYIYAQQIAQKNEKDAQKLIDERDQKEAELRKKQAERANARANDLAKDNEAEKKHYYDYAAIMEAETRKDQEESIKRIMQAEHERRLRQQGYQVIASNFAQAFQMMASIGGKHARQWFTMYKMAAISEAIISTYAGATRALKDYPAPISYAVAAAITAAGLAKVAAIRAQTFQGGGGGAGGGAVGSFPANPATGLPESGGAPATQSGPIVNVHVYGSVMGDPTAIARELVPYIITAQNDGVH